MATILITGGLGYIGSHTALAFHEAGHEVLLLDNLANAEIQTLDRLKKISGKKFQFNKVDLQDDTKLRNYIKTHPQIDAVIHFAAYKSVSESVSNPIAYYQNNLVGLLNLLRVMQENNMGNLVFSSSCSVYGEVKELPVTEQTPIHKPVSPYGNTKKIGEEILQDVAQAFPDFFNITSLRYFNPIGAHESGLLGETSRTAPNNLLPLLMQKALGLRKEFKIWGNDYDTPDGTCIRDYIHVEDLAEAHVKATEYALNKPKKQAYQVFNLGTGKGCSVLEVIQTFEQVSGITLSYQMAPRRQGDVSAIYANAQLAENVLEWKAKRNLADMVLSAWHWEQYYQNKKSK